MMAGSENLPLWNLDEVYPGFDSDKYLDAKKRAASISGRSTAFFARGVEGDLGDWLVTALALNDEAGSLFGTLGAYAYARYSTATRDEAAMAELNAVEALQLGIKKASVLFRNAIAARRDDIVALVDSDPRFASYAFHVKEEIFWQSKQMSPELEDLAEDLGRSGADAWSRLQETVSSNASVLWDEATGERKTVVQLRNLAYDPDRKVREKAYNLELDAWKAVEIPVASALNGVKGSVNALNARRGWKDALEKSTAQARISRATLDSLILAMEESLPVWRRYLKAKATLLGVKTCAFYDLFAPAALPGAAEVALPSFTWDQAREFIFDKFSSFDPAMGAFAARAFAGNWIDARPREGKVGGAYCTDFPDSGVARVLCNFDGSFSALGTVAHELGHAWHHECIKDKPWAIQQYPMTLAETASIFAETVVSEAALKAAAPSGRLPLIESHLQDACQVIVDILSRFYFERAIHDARQEGELSADRFCELMLDAQTRTYGDGLDPEKRHKYMWAVKGHYYIPSLSYYNFPYAFGQLFGLGLYERYREEGQSFAAAYRDLLARTGSASAVDVAASAGFDIEKPDFLRSSLRIFERQTAEFEALTVKAVATAKATAGANR